MSIGIASHNPKVTVPSNVCTSNQIIPSKNPKTQEHLNDICKWTADKKMKLNVDKTKNIIFNFSKNHQFSTEIKLDGKVIETSYWAPSSQTLKLEKGYRKDCQGS